MAEHRIEISLVESTLNTVRPRKDVIAAQVSVVWILFYFLLTLDNLNSFKDHFLMTGCLILISFQRENSVIALIKSLRCKS